MENITPFDLGGLAKDLDNQLIGMRSPFGPAEDRPLHEASYVGMKHAFEALGGKYKVDRHGSLRHYPEWRARRGLRNDPSGGRPGLGASIRL